LASHLIDLTSTRLGSVRAIKSVDSKGASEDFETDGAPIPTKHLQAKYCRMSEFPEKINPNCGVESTPSNEGEKQKFPKTISGKMVKGKDQNSFQLVKRPIVT
jgi:hypothetical protein